MSDDFEERAPMVWGEHEFLGDECAEQNSVFADKSSPKYERMRLRFAIPENALHNVAYFSKWMHRALHRDKMADTLDRMGSYPAGVGDVPHWNEAKFAKGKTALGFTRRPKAFAEYEEQFLAGTLDPAVAEKYHAIVAAEVLSLKNAVRLIPLGTRFATGLTEYKSHPYFVWIGTRVESSAVSEMPEWGASTASVAPSDGEIPF